MTTPDTRAPVRITRRGALAGAAWTAPVVVVASAVPAFASSPSNSLVINRGGSGSTLTQDGPDEFYDLEFSGLSVVVPSALTAGQLTLTVTYTPSTPGGPAGLFVQGVPVGWTVSPTVGTNGAPVVVFTYAAGVLAGTEVQVESSIFVGAEQPRPLQTGTYVLTAAAPGLTSDVEAFVTPSARATGLPRAVPRPTV